MVQVNNTKLFIRLKFKKTGKLQYVSHLDLVRTMHKVIVRAGLPLWYTEGFNPKPKMIFAAPLSIGTESQAEFMDLRLNEPMEPGEVMARLNRNMVSDMQITEAYYPDSKFTELKWLSYRMRFFLCEDILSAFEKIKAALSSDSLTVTKKNDDKLIDIKPLMRLYEVTTEDGYIEIYALLSADQSAFLNPEYLVKALKENVGILKEENLMREHYTVMRERAYFDDLSEFR